MSDHTHPHGIVGKPNPERIWFCEECGHAFTDDEARRDAADGQWGHPCYGTRVNTGCRCESHLDAFLPESLCDSQTHQEAVAK